MDGSKREKRERGSEVSGRRHPGFPHTRCLHTQQRLGARSERVRVSEGLERATKSNGLGRGACVGEAKG